MSTIKKFILCLLVCGVFVSPSIVAAMDKGLSEDNMVVVDDAYAALSENKLKEAERLVKIAFKSQPDNYQLHMIMAEIMEKKQNWSGVVKYLTPVIKAFPNDAYAYASRGFALLNQEKTDLALKDLERSLKVGKLQSDVARNVAAAIENIHAIDVVEEVAVAETKQPDNYTISEDLWSKAEYYKDQNNPGLSLKYGRESVKRLPDNRDRILQMAYLALHFEQDKEAVMYFEKAIAIKKPTAEEGFIEGDMYYAYKRLGEKEKALFYLEKIIEASNKKLEKAGKNASTEDIANNYYLRREHADFERKFGANTSFYYNRMRDGGGYALQGIQEIYWQPYYNNGRSVQIFATGIQTLKSDIYQDGSKSLYAIAGITVDPSKDYNLSLGVDHVFKIGDATEEDTRLRVAHSWDMGAELNPVASGWHYVTLFQEYLYALQNNYSVYSAEARAGRSFKIASRLVVSPHAFVSANYNSLNSTVIVGGKDWDVYGGPGIALRQWYREDKLNAPKSYLDLVVQYRFGITSQSDDMLYVVLSNSF